MISWWVFKAVGGVELNFFFSLGFLVCCRAIFLLSNGMQHIGGNFLRFKSYKRWRKGNFFPKTKSFIISLGKKRGQKSSFFLSSLWKMIRLVWNLAHTTHPLSNSIYHSIEQIFDFYIFYHFLALLKCVKCVKKITFFGFLGGQSDKKRP